MEDGRKAVGKPPVAGPVKSDRMPANDLRCNHLLSNQRAFSQIIIPAGVQV